MITIDIHHHFYPSGRDNGGRDWSVDLSLDQLDSNGIGTAIVSLPPVSSMGDPAATARAQNEWAAGLCQRHPRRFGLFASLPLLDADATVAEIAYAFDVLHADGIGLPTSDGDVWLSDPRFLPMFAELDRRRAAVFFHPYATTRCRALSLEYGGDLVTPPWLEFPTNTARLILGLLARGVPRRFPHVRFIFCHGGGTMPSILGRIAGFDGWPAVGPDKLAAAFPGGVHAGFAGLYFDLAQASDPLTFGLLRQLTPESHLLFGSDYGYFSVSHAVRQVAGLGLADGPSGSGSGRQRGYAVSTFHEKDALTGANDMDAATISRPVPVYDADLFASDALRAPFGHYRALRELGPVARLSDPDVYVLSRFDAVRDALRAPDVLVSEEGVGFSDAFNKPGAPNVIASDGDLHARLRVEVMRPLSLGQLRQHRAFLKEMIADAIDPLVDCGPFDAMAAIARVLPLQAISLLVGLPEAGRAAMLDWAAATFNAVGPLRDDFATDFRLLGEARVYLAGQSRDTVRPGSWAHALFDAVDAGRLTEAEAKGAMSAYVLPSLDTTIYAKGHLLHCLAADPAQWATLRANPAMIPGAVIESVRHSSVIRWFSRLAREDYAVEDCVIPAGARVMLIYASANRDERKFADPDRFDIRREAGAQLSWGTGRHMCAGLHLARIEMEVMLEALVERCAMIGAEAPVLGANRGLYGFERLVMRLGTAV